MSTISSSHNNFFFQDVHQSLSLLPPQETCISYHFESKDIRIFRIRSFNGLLRPLNFFFRQIPCSFYNAIERIIHLAKKKLHQYRNLIECRNSVDKQLLIHDLTSMGQVFQQLKQLALTNQHSHDKKLHLFEKRLSKIQRTSLEHTSHLSNKSPLELACEKGFYDQALLYIKEGATLSNLKQEDLNRLLDLAWKYKQISVSFCLIINGADPNSIPEARDELLLIACTRQITDIALLLISKGANPNYCDKEGTPVFVLACIHHLENVALRLLEQGANVLATSQNGYNMLWWACTENLPNVALSLIDKGINLNIEAPDHSVALHWAFDKQLYSVAEKILKSGYINNEKSLDVNHLLNKAIQLGWEDIAYLMIQNGWNPSLTDDLGYTPLHYAALHNQPRLIRALIKSGASSRATLSHSLDTPLHLAFSQGQKEACQALLESGADPTALNNNNQTPLLCLLLNTQADPDFLANKHQIIRNLFGSVETLHSILQSDSNQVFVNLMRNAESIVHDCQQARINPLWICSYFRHYGFTHAIAKSLRQLEFLRYLNELSKIYHKNDFGFLIYPALAINEDHFKDINLELDILPPPSHTKLSSLLDLFDSINWEDSLSPKYVDPSNLLLNGSPITKTQLRSSLETLNIYTTQRIPCTGTPSSRNPKAVKRFYRNLEHMLCHVLEKLLNSSEIDEKTRLTTIVQLAKDSLGCPGRWLAATFQVYNKVCLNKPLDLKRLLLLSLGQLHELIVLEILHDKIRSAPILESHAYLRIIDQIGNKRGIPNARFLAKLNDQYVPPYNEKRLLDWFDRSNSVDRNVDWIHEQTFADSDFRDECFSWFKQNIPSEWEIEKFNMIHLKIQKLRDKKYTEEQIKNRLLEKYDIFCQKGNDHLIERTLVEERAHDYLQLISDIQETRFGIKKCYIAYMMMELGILKGVFKDTNLKHFLSELIFWR